MFSSNASQVSSDANYIEDVFSTWLYTGNGSTQTINNGIDLAGKGGMVWIKNRSGAYDHNLADSARGLLSGTYKTLATNLTAAENYPSDITSFNSNGFSLSGNGFPGNDSSSIYASWTFRKAPKFFDVVTYTGDGTVGRNIPHNLMSVPGCVIVKRTSSSEGWYVSHRGVNSGFNVGYLNLTNAFTNGVNTAIPVGYATETTFRVSNTPGQTYANQSGQTYVAYLFAHDAGGFGLTGTDNVISCGSYTGNGSATGPVVTLGYEPQWVLIKRTSTAGTDWNLIDNMRGFNVGANGDAELYPNSSAAENPAASAIDPLATGFQVTTTAGAYNLSGGTYIYIAIRRGPMKTPTTGTSVFDVDLANPGNSTITTTFPVDLNLGANRAGSAANFNTVDRLRGGVALRTSATDAEQAVTVTLDSMNSFSNAIFGSGNHVFYSYKRAPGFMDVVCYTGTGATNNVAHNLTVTPELIIAKRRNTTAQDWCVAVAAPSLGAGYYRTLTLNTTEASATNGNNKATATTFDANVIYNASSSATANVSAATYVAYLFASCPGVSKVGSYTGTGTTQQINCGFTGGARFVLIRRTDSTGSWYCWDSARGIVAGNDPYLILNSPTAEITSNDFVDTYSAGFEISSTAPAAINASGGAFIFLAIA